MGRLSAGGKRTLRHDSIHINYVKEITKLSLWFVHKRLCEGESDFEALVNGRVNIYRNTSLYDGKHHPANGEAAPEWTEILKELRTVFDRYMGAPSTEQFEAAGLDLLLPHLKKTSGCTAIAGDPTLRVLELRLRRRSAQHPHPQRLSTSISSERYADSVCCRPDSVAARLSG